MQKIACYVALMWGVLSLVACGSVEKFDPSSFDEVIYQPRYAEGFDVRRSSESGAVLITVRNPWQGADDVEHRLLIDRKGAYRRADLGGVQRIEGDAKRVVCFSSSYVAMLAEIGSVERVVGVSGIDFITNEWVQSNRNKVGDVGYDGNTNYELLLALDPDIVLLYGISASSAVENKLRELGIAYAYVGEYVESSPLGKAEWLVALAEIVGRREVGEEKFAQIEEQYLRAGELIKQEVGQGARPMVMLNTPYRDVWVVPARNSYMVRLIEDAGGVTHTIDNLSNSSQPIDMEQALLYAHESDFWLNVGGCNTLEELKRENPKFADVEAIKQGRVYNNTRIQTPMGGSDFWESGVVRPDRVLKDLCKILHPELLTEHELFYYKQLK